MHSRNYPDADAPCIIPVVLHQGIEIVCITTVLLEVSSYGCSKNRPCYGQSESKLKTVCSDIKGHDMNTA